MQIQDLNLFLDYFEKIHQRTMRVARCIPSDKIEWTYREGRFTLGDLVRHIATINRYMYAETVSGRPSRYAGCGKELADGYEAVMEFAERLHRESVEIFFPAHAGGPEPQGGDAGWHSDYLLEVAAGDDRARGTSSRADLSVSGDPGSRDASAVRADVGAGAGEERAGLAANVARAPSPAKGFEPQKSANRKIWSRLDSGFGDVSEVRMRG
jgi:hypothetical protein